MASVLMKAAAGLAVIGFAGVATAQGYGDPAQQQHQQTAPPQSSAAQQPAGDVEDAELAKFSQANQQVTAIRGNYMEQAQGKDDPQAMAEIQMSMQEEMVEAVEKIGLDVSDYNRIAQLVSQDPELRDRLESMQ